MRELDSKKIRESNLAVKGFTKQYTINGSKGIDPQLFFKHVQPQVTDLLLKIVRQRLTLFLRVKWKRLI